MGIDLSAFVGEALEEYSSEVLSAVNDTLRETAKEAVSELKTAGGFHDRSGNYRKGWKAKMEPGTLGVENQIIYNAKHYRVTHLLEYGHVTRTGKRTRAFPHIAPVEERLGDKIEQKMKERLG